MSLSYEHLLVPIASDYRPVESAVGEFFGKLVHGGHVPANIDIHYARVIKGDPRRMRGHNPSTGETIEVLGPSRRVEKPELLESAAKIPELARHDQEYDTWVSGVGEPSNPPLELGYVKNDSWIRMDEPYFFEVRCRVRNHIVRLFNLESEGDLDKPMDFASLANRRPRFGEDCGEEEDEGLFVHPECGAIRIQHAGCAMFWIEFNFGKWIFPMTRDGSIAVLDPTVLALAREEFETEFVQACNWG